MSAVITPLTERHAAIRDAINARARSTGASEPQRQVAMTTALGAYRDGKSAAASIALGQSKLPRRYVYHGTGPSAA